MHRRVGVWSGVGVAAVAAVGLGVFWKLEGLEEAGWLAGVLSAFVALATLAIFLHDRSPSRPGPRSPETDPPGGAVSGAGTINTFKDATSAGSVVMGRDISGPVTSGSPSTPAPSAPSGPSDGPGASGPAPATGAAPGTAGEGAVSNTFSGGFAQGPVVMGRDISGPVTWLPSASGPAQGGDRQPGEDDRPGSDEPPSGGGRR